MKYTVTKIENIDNTIYAYLDNGIHIVLTRMDLNANRIRTKFGVQLSIDDDIVFSDSAMKDLIRVKMWR